MTPIFIRDSKPDALKDILERQRLGITVILENDNDGVVQTFKQAWANAKRDLEQQGFSFSETNPTSHSTAIRILRPMTEKEARDAARVQRVYQALGHLQGSAISPGAILDNLAAQMAVPLERTLLDALNTHLPTKCWISPSALYTEIESDRQHAACAMRA